MIRYNYFLFYESDTLVLREKNEVAKLTKEEMQQKLFALSNGEEKEINIKKEDFMIFLEVWNQHPEKNNFIGEAGLGGNVVYRHKNGE